MNNLLSTKISAIFMTAYSRKIHGNTLHHIITVSFLLFIMSIFENHTNFQKDILLLLRIADVVLDICCFVGLYTGWIFATEQLPSVSVHSTMCMVSYSSSSQFIDSHSTFTFLKNNHIYLTTKEF